MNRPKRNEHSREKILQTGMELFKRKGYHGTGLKEILDTCQVPKGSFYNYFESKEQFAVEILEYSHQLEDEKWDKRTNAIEGNLLERFRLAINLFIADYENDPDATGCLLTNLMGEVGNASDSFREIISLSCTRVIDCIEESFKEGQLQGSFRNDLPARAIAQLFWDSWQGALLRTKVEASTAPLREVTDTIFTLYAPLENPVTNTKDGDNNDV